MGRPLTAKCLWRCAALAEGKSGPYSTTDALFALRPRRDRGPSRRTRSGPTCRRAGGAHRPRHPLRLVAGLRGIDAHIRVAPGALRDLARSRCTRVTSPLGDLGSAALRDVGPGPGRSDVARVHLNPRQPADPWRARRARLSPGRHLDAAGRRRAAGPRTESAMARRVRLRSWPWSPDRSRPSASWASRSTSPISIGSPASRRAPWPS